MKNEDSLNKSAQFVKGVGPKKIKVLNRLGIETIDDLFYHFPYRYEDRNRLKKISDLEIGKIQSVEAEVLVCGLKRIKSGKTIFEMAVGDDTGKLFIIWFNQPYLKDYFKIGDKLILYGKVEKKKRLQLVNPEYEIISCDEKDDYIHTRRIVPIYPLTKGINQRSLRKIIYKALEKFVHLKKDFLPHLLKNKYNLLHITLAMKNIHFPESFLLLEKSRRRLIFEEFFKLQLIMAFRRLKNKTEAGGISHKLKEEEIEEFRRLLLFKLTSSQEEVIKDIEFDMASPISMQRLLQGDVASGKTVVAAYALWLTVKNGYQGALMVPTEILAKQHYLNLKKLFKGSKLNLLLLVSDMSKKEKENAKAKIKKHKANIIIGTHTLIQSGVEFKKLGLVVIDEQHKFGVAQREVLKKKGVNPDILVMTATPIPRTLAYTVYGDLDISVIKELPPGRKSVTTWWVTDKKRAGAYEFIRKQINSGRQVYIVYPIIEESKVLDIRAAKSMHRELKNKIFSEFEVGLIHGQMKSKDKEKVMGDFKKGKVDLLVSTIVIEVGIDISNASIMLIEHAERFGLSQLHQLRGRIGRGGHESYCILVSSSKTEKAKKRLASMSKYHDGFKIAEEDLLLRGPGEFFGKRQHGAPELKIGNILTDVKLLELARGEAFNLAEEDPCLKRQEHKDILEYIKIYL